MLSVLYQVDEEVSVVEILDTAGQEDFSSLRAQWMAGKDGYLFVYSLVDRVSLQEVYSFIELLEQVGHCYLSRYCYGHE